MLSMMRRMIVSTREVLMRDLLDQEEGPDASDDDQIGLHVFLIVRVAMMIVIVMVMVVVIVMVVMIVMIMPVVMPMTSMIVSSPAKMR